MINFQVFALVAHLRILEEWEKKHQSQSLLFEQQEIQKIDIGVSRFVPNEMIEAFRGSLGFSSRLAENLELQAVHDRVDIFALRLSAPISHADFSSEIRVLKEAFISGINYVYLYLYPKEKAKSLLRYSADWADVIKAFRSSEEDVKCAVDCWALGHATASVFHAMRAAEHGLRAIARERKIVLPRDKPIEWATWQEIIKKIRDAQGEIGRTKKPGAVKDEALAFYSGALAHLDGFKDKYRNSVMHARVNYDEYQAGSALFHVKEFMVGLSKKIDDSGKPIRWRFS